MATTNLQISDRDGIRKAMKSMKPGDQIEILGSESPITIGVPSLESDTDSDDLPLRWQRGRSDSWFD